MDELQLLLNKIDDYQDQLKDYLAQGSLNEIKDYHRIVGRIEGMNVLRQDIETMVERIVEA